MRGTTSHRDLPLVYLSASIFLLAAIWVIEFNPLSRLRLPLLLVDVLPHARHNHIKDPD